MKIDVLLRVEFVAGYNLVCSNIVVHLINRLLSSISLIDKGTLLVITLVLQISGIVERVNLTGEQTNKNSTNKYKFQPSSHKHIKT